MTWDAVRQYDQALSQDYDDWHPPAMEWLWRQFDRTATGPAPMLLLQLTLYWAGFALLIAWACRQRRQAVAAILLAATALLPIPLALMGAVLKDCLMAGALLAASGLLAWLPERGRWPWGALGIALLLGAATLRFNALPACLPILLALLPASWRPSPVKFAAATVVGALALAAAMPLANRAIGAKPSGVELSLVMFDLGGISAHSGVDQFPDLGIGDAVAVNRRCYSPVKWDPYSWWVEHPCPIGFERMHAWIGRTHASAYGPWLRAILSHPIAYAEHRLVHFNINARFLVHDEIERPVQIATVPNDWGFHEANGWSQRLIDRAARWSAHSPLGWPIWWVALAFGCIVLAPALPSRRLVLPIALSALLYGLGYLVFSVAAELRYHLWTMLGAGIAAALVAGDVGAAERIARARLILAAAPLAVVTILCVLWRLLPF